MYVHTYIHTVSSLLSRFLSNPSHGAFVDSCSHHCTSCSASAENVWAGPRIFSTSYTHTEDMNPVKSFGYDTMYCLWSLHKYVCMCGYRRWFEQSISVSHPDLSERFFYQNKSFPCDSCCLCRVYH